MGGGVSACIMCGTISSLTKWKGEKNTCVVARNLVVDYSLLPLTTPLLLVGAYVEGEEKKSVRVVAQCCRRQLVVRDILGVC
jgi:hypothetical protein